jgi:hypothetical protein
MYLGRVDSTGLERTGKHDPPSNFICRTDGWGIEPQISALQLGMEVSGGSLIRRVI